MSESLIALFLCKILGGKQNWHTEKNKKRLHRRAEWLTKRAENRPVKEILLNRAERYYKEAEEYKKAAETVEE